MKKVIVGSYEIDATDYSTIAGASVGLVLWILATYAFRSHVVPGAVQAFVTIVLPAVVTRIAAMLTRVNTTTAAHAAEHAAGQPGPRAPQPPTEGTGGPADGNVRIL
jgi:hypothetical protein